MVLKPRETFPDPRKPILRRKPQGITAAKPNQGRFADKKVFPTLALPLTWDRETVFNSLSALSGKPLGHINPKNDKHGFLGCLIILKVIHLQKRIETMETREIIRVIRKLPVSKRMLIVERTLKTIRESSTRKKMVEAANALLEDYKNDKGLTIFTQLDYEAFYEAR